MRRITADRYMGRYGDGLPHHGTVRVLSERDYRLMLAMIASGYCSTDVRAFAADAIGERNAP
jgi:hypothetical protein